MNRDKRSAVLIENPQQHVGWTSFDFTGHLKQAPRCWTMIGEETVQIQEAGFPVRTGNGYSCIVPLGPHVRRAWFEIGDQSSE